MNLIFCADLHIRSNRPQFRKDDYWKTVCRKFRQIIYLCNKHNANLVIAGDIFDSTKVGHKVVNKIIEYIKKLKGYVLVVAGQHDQVYHKKDLKDSPLFTLILSEKVILLNREDFWEVGINKIYGCSWGEEPIKPEGANNILVIHKTITPEEPPHFLTEAWSAEKALDTWEGYFLIVSGDYHQPFIVQKWGNVLVNCGPMMRSSIDQIDIEPTIYLYNTETEKIKGIKLKIEPAEKVFALENIKNRDSKFSEELKSLIETLKSKSERPDYKETVNLLIEKGNIRAEVKNKINSILGSI